MIDRIFPWFALVFDAVMVYSIIGFFNYKKESELAMRGIEEAPPRIRVSKWLYTLAYLALALFICYYAITYTLVRSESLLIEVLISLIVIEVVLIETWCGPVTVGPSDKNYALALRRVAEFRLGVNFIAAAFVSIAAYAVFVN